MWLRVLLNVVNILQIPWWLNRLRINHLLSGGAVLLEENHGYAIINIHIRAQWKIVNQAKNLDQDINKNCKQGGEACNVFPCKWLTVWTLNTNHAPASLYQMIEPW